jgi:hypothetical protein
MQLLGSRRWRQHRYGGTRTGRPRSPGSSEDPSCVRRHSVKRVSRGKPLIGRTNSAARARSSNQGATREQPKTILLRFEYRILPGGNGYVAF